MRYAAVNGSLYKCFASVGGVYQVGGNRWEYGHAAGFVIQLLGLVTLLISIVVETPQHVPQLAR